MLKVLETRPDFFNLMFVELVEFKSIHAHDLFLTLFPEGIQIVEGIVHNDPDRLRPIPLPMLIRSFLGLFFSYYLTEMIIAPRAPEEFKENAMEHLVDIYLHGILDK